MVNIINRVYDGAKIITDVLVIVSTYNGEKYLREQLDSVLAQKGVEVHILVRDDGSKDATIDILQEYSERNDNVIYYIGENKGVIRSFNDLMMRSEINEYDYIAFCDQDDVWDNDKLVTAISVLKDAEHNIPVVYCSNLMLVDENFNKIGIMRRNICKYTKHMAVVQNIGTGCTQVFNQKAAEMYRNGIDSHMEMHDYWMTLVCMFFGKILYDTNPHIRYRQHERNVVGAKKKEVRIAFKNLSSKGNKRINMLNDFMTVYNVNDTDRKVISKVASYDESFLNKLIILFSFRYVGIDSRVTVGFKLRAIMGRMY